MEGCAEVGQGLLTIKSQTDHLSDTIVFQHRQHAWLCRERERQRQRQRQTDSETGTEKETDKIR